jgi:hypothetical protein
MHYSYKTHATLASVAAISRFLHHFRRRGNDDESN